ncbi:MAG: tRNA glutamyl-Q(34) synthetase GluQRS [Trueperaceae bacterium]|nr:tRNA glutamyl-Q(34) synthetase GluQRS [Trueperaceae bacterium]
MTHQARRGRYAPSPTGFLHLGNARTALVAWWRARATGSPFVMRVEDLDGPRTVAAALTGNLAELRWLGLDWDEGPDVGGPFGPYRQSERGEHYEWALGVLRDQGLIFECYLSRKDLRELASAPHEQMPVYGPSERAANAACEAEKRAEGKMPSLRVRLEPQQITFTDLLAGPRSVAVHDKIGDFVVRRADGLWAYQLAVVVDDIAMQIGEVVRGDDLLTSTAAQLVLYRALGAKPPQYLHVPLLLDDTGERMAKRRGSLTLKALQEDGVRPERVVGLLAYTLGLLDELREISAREMIAAFSVDRLSRKAGRLEPPHLTWLYNS